MNARSMQGQVALVTGGGGGIGSAICQRLAAAGAKVIITYRKSVEQAEAVAAQLPGSDHLVAQASVTDSAALAGLAEQVAGRYGRLDLLVNNAGITTPVPHEDLDALSDGWIDRIFQTNWRGAFASVRAFKALLQADDGGTIVNLSSIAGVTGVGSNVAYCASKAALDSMTRSLARALAPKIRVVSVSPGWVLGEYAKKMDPAYIRQQEEMTPLKRLASPEDVAETVWAVATKLTFMTGNIVPVDGGRPLL
ncbi:SDR family NAD(P)-dependent oxidoreductase [Candidatus Leptofilum sp.]|uniref:SDR family NAD(P)-dependent oxidoreductase n=1 Tax=Candidatus Leptofilum sp. TaxID=3241576 RepID=UPI003B5CC99E